MDGAGQPPAGYRAYPAGLAVVAERSGGADAAEASAVASRRVGPAIVASAAALAAGFAALAVSPVPMVRDFGLWCAGDLAPATAAVLVLLPPAARAWLR